MVADASVGWAMRGMAERQGPVLGIVLCTIGRVRHVEPCLAIPSGKACACLECGGPAPTTSALPPPLTRGGRVVVGGEAKEEEEDNGVAGDSVGATIIFMILSSHERGGRGGRAMMMISSASMVSCKGKRRKRESDYLLSLCLISRCRSPSSSSSFPRKKLQKPEIALSPLSLLLQGEEEDGERLSPFRLLHLPLLLSFIFLLPLQEVADSIVVAHPPLPPPS
ncbi:hypothetical protein BHE74_00019357 [Ensete ventricosum]|nr:hypothetical protein GW17_00022328 [Ensete ventricosum]RWW72816.1 hypothetical protein BHE74_00019357 [Ensete ventricosum]RZR96519.1 hypothetical protein BHM03_00025551 [Ensete ventricosum]